MQIVRGARSRYDGVTRNPFNEYECGNYYARALSSYALLQALTGFAYSAVTRRLTFAPGTNQHPFSTFFCAAPGYGTITCDGDRLTIEMLEGELPIDTLVFGKESDRRTLSVKKIARPSESVVIRV